MTKADTPDVEYAKEGDEKKLDARTEVALMQSGRKVLSAEDRDVIRKVAEFYDLPIMGITLLGGKPYVNVTGLDDRVKKGWLDKGWVKSESSKVLQRATKETKHLAGYEVTIDMFNQAAFVEGLKAVASNNTPITPEVLQALRGAFTMSFKAEGWASPDSCEGIAYTYKGPKGEKVKDKLLIENVNMIAERKASNRAKRAATSCGLTSVEEMPGAMPSAIDVEFETGKEAPKKKRKRQTPVKEEATTEKKEEPVAKEEPKSEPEKEGRAVQTSRVALDEGKYNPQGPPTEWQWKQLDIIHKSLGDNNWREILDGEGVTQENDLTLDKADTIIKEHPTKDEKDEELPLES